MPELPDITVYADNLARITSNKKIVSVIYHKSQRLNVRHQTLSDALINQNIIRADRQGKEICLFFSNGNWLSIHLMLRGGFNFTTAPSSIRFPILSIAFDDNSYIIVSDPKGWVTVSLNQESDSSIPDALEVSADYLKAIIGKKPKALAKAFLIDQKVLKGIGNAYADEILWQARISPKSIVGKLPNEAIELLAASIKSVLNHAITKIREKSPDIISGEVRDFLEIHNPLVSKSPTGFPINREEISSKTTYFTNEQILYT